MPNENKIQNNENDQEEEILSSAQSKKKSSIRTFRADASEYIKNKKLSLVDLAVMKQQAAKGGGLPLKRKGTLVRLFNNKSLLALIVLLILLLGLGAYFVFTYERKEDIISVVQPPTPLLANQTEIIIDITNSKDLRTEIDEAFLKEFTPGDLVYMPIKRQLGESVIYLKTNDFFNTLKTSTPASLTSFLQENFFLGVLNLEKRHPVLILEIEKGHEQTIFGGMLSWEKYIPDDLDFMIEEIVMSAFPIFKDKIIDNNHTRLLQTEGETVLLYTFLNNQFIIITDSERALKEIINRFVLFKFS